MTLKYDIPNKDEVVPWKYSHSLTGADFSVLCIKE
jgi:hypothetical protein